MPLETVPFDVAKHLTDPGDQAELVAEAFATGAWNSFIADQKTVQSIPTRQWATCQNL